jgi:RPA family protein
LSQGTDSYRGSKTEFQPRQIAYIVRIADILRNNFVKEEDYPDYVQIGSKNVSRVNIIGTVIAIDNGKIQNIIVDDGTEKIAVRSFDKTYSANVGDVVLVIGRIRQYNSERYISPEIIRSDIDKKWALIWGRNSLKSDCAEELPEEEVEKAADDNNKCSVLEKIRELDDGGGALYEEVVREFKDEKMIYNLLEQGEVFQIKPGRLKVLD